MNNRSAPPGAVVPTLIYDDVGAALTWLCGAFGFAERLRAAGADGVVGHAQVSTGDGAVMLGVSRAEAGSASTGRVEFRPPRLNEVSHSVTVRVEDVDAHHERARAFGARIISPPATYPFGERQYTAEDPQGHRWSFTQSVADIAPGAWGATAAGL
jgi:uncharacterized glyoxalase superfamily protein PhnB